MLLGMYTIIALAFVSPLINSFLHGLACAHDFQYVYPDDLAKSGLNLLSLLPGGSS